MRIGELSQSMPDGYELISIYDQGYESAVANQGFILNPDHISYYCCCDSAVLYRIQKWALDR